MLEPDTATTSSRALPPTLVHRTAAATAEPAVTPALAALGLVLPVLCFALGRWLARPKE